MPRGRVRSTNVLQCCREPDPELAVEYGIFSVAQAREAGLLGGARSGAGCGTGRGCGVGRRSPGSRGTHDAARRRPPSSRALPADRGRGQPPLAPRGLSAGASAQPPGRPAGHRPPPHDWSRAARLVLHRRDARRPATSQVGRGSCRSPTRLAPRWTSLRPDLTREAAVVAVDSALRTRHRSRGGELEAASRPAARTCTAVARPAALDLASPWP